MISNQACKLECKPEEGVKVKAPKARRKLKEIQRDFVCNILGCSRIYASEQSLKQHKKRKHKFFSAHEESKRIQMLERESMNTHMGAIRADKHNQMYQRLSAARASYIPIPRAVVPCQQIEQREVFSIPTASDEFWPSAAAISNLDYNTQNRAMEVSRSKQCSLNPSSSGSIECLVDQAMSSAVSSSDEGATMIGDQNSFSRSTDSLDSALSVQSKGSCAERNLLNAPALDALSVADSFMFPELASLEHSDVLGIFDNGLGSDMQSFFGQDLFSDDLHIDLNMNYGLGATTNTAANSPDISFSSSASTHTVDDCLAPKDSTFSDSATIRGSMPDLQLHSLSSAPTLESTHNNSGPLLNQIMDLIEANRRINLQLMSLT